MQTMFTGRTGDVVLPATLATSGGSELFHSVTQDSWSDAIFIKLVNCAGSPQPVHVSVNGATKLSRRATVVTLSSSSPQDTSTPSDPERIVPRTHTLRDISPAFDLRLAPCSITVIELQPERRGSHHRK